MDKAKNRATVDGVLDARTRKVLSKFCNDENGNEVHFSSLFGVIATGKEANVYHGVFGSAEEDRAVKIFKTRKLAFRDRWQYIEGERRFDGQGVSQGYKMVVLWAQKEYRNLIRLRQAGIPCPAPLAVKKHVIVMGFLGEKGLAYPRLEQVRLESGDDDDVENGRQWTGLYATTVAYMRRMYKVCKLVHGDLSGYNLLYDAGGNGGDGMLYVIDVSQSLTADHANADPLLCTDIKNVSIFFQRRGADVLPYRDVFHVIKKDDASTDMESCRADVLAAVAAQPADRPQADVDSDNQVFAEQHIPKSLHELMEDVDPNDPAVRALTGLDDLAVEEKGEDDEEVEEDDDDEDDDSESGGASIGLESSDDSDSDGAFSDKEARDPKKPRGHRHEDKEEKRERKKEVKEAKREKRQTKMPKKVKKKLVADTKRSKRG